ncbi:hypothetical protein PTNB73_06326 [Pyrenophora teres f. teres]|nr:hypothetical protein PTNB73_06326 [Pyrenophora teres f. teres]
MPWSPSSFSARQFVKIDPAHQNATQWRVDKLQELSVVNVTAALIASVVSGAFSWPMVDEAPWTAKASFYSTLFISLSAVAAGAQQSIALDRYGQHPEGIRQLQELLRGGSSGSVSWLQLYVWQLPIMLLNISIVLFLVGLLILIWARAAHSAAWDDDMKVCTPILLLHRESGVDRPTDRVRG